MMYKKQMTVQKVICLLSVIASVLMFVYALGLMTELYDSLYPAMTLETMAQKMVHRAGPRASPIPIQASTCIMTCSPLTGSCWRSASG